MNKLILLTFLLINLFVFGQNVTVKGIAIDSTNGRNKVLIIVNDTIQKYYDNHKSLLNSYTFDMKEYAALFKNKEYAIRVSNKNKFKLKAKLTDSLTFRSFHHIPQSYLVKDLIKKEKINIILVPEECKQYLPCKEENPKLYVFIGKKIKVSYAEEQYYCNRIIMDSKFNATYQIAENLYGDFKKDTINFTVYDHYGRPRFSEQENVILYVAEYCGELIHIKYLYNSVYETKDGRWANQDRKENEKKIDSLNIKKPTLIELKDETIYGNYAIDIFELMKKIALKSRGFFQ